MGEVKLKRYSITVDGFDPCTVVAKSAGAARYQCYRGWRDAGYGARSSFADFLRRTTTLHHGRALLEKQP